MFQGLSADLSQGSNTHCKSRHLNPASPQIQQCRLRGEMIAELLHSLSLPDQSGNGRRKFLLPALRVKFTPEQKIAAEGVTPGSSGAGKLLSKGAALLPWSPCTRVFLAHQGFQEDGGEMRSPGRPEPSLPPTSAKLSCLQPKQWPLNPDPGGHKSPPQPRGFSCCAQPDSRAG